MAIVINGDALDQTRLLSDKCVNSVITSPPYWQLRDYGFTGQWGLEKTFQEYLENLWSLFDEIYRVLADHGTCFVNLGDTYGTQSGNMRNPVPCKESDYAGDAIKIIQPKVIHKCLLMIPARFAIGMIDRGWILRNDIIWGKRNSMPESVTDRFSKKHEHVFFFVKQKDYFFDLEAVKDNAVTNDKSLRNRDITKLNNTPGRSRMKGLVHNDYSMRNPGDVSDFWDITTKANRANHYAAYNAQLIDKPILAGCPEGGVILDPFCGTGTTLVRALQLGRDAIGIDGNKEYCDIAIGNISKAPNAFASVV